VIADTRFPYVAVMVSFAVLYFADAAGIGIALTRPGRAGA
jgi:hypothetical protein